MECPICRKKDTLMPARTSELSKTVDGFKCTLCDRLFIMNESNHLTPYTPSEARRIALARENAKAPAAEPEKPAPSRKLEDEDLQPGIREGFLDVLKKVTRPISPPKEKPNFAIIPSTVAPSKDSLPKDKYHRLTQEQRDIAIARLIAGDKAVDIAHDLKCKDAAIGWHKRKLIAEGKIAIKHRHSHRWHRTSEQKKARHITTPAEEDEIAHRLNVGEKAPRIAHDMNIARSAIYNRAKKLGIHKYKPKDLSKDEAIPERAQRLVIIDCTAIVIRMASNNGYIITDVDDDVYIYPDKKSLIAAIEDWA